MSVPAHIATMTVDCAVPGCIFEAEPGADKCRQHLRRPPSAPRVVVGGMEYGTVTPERLELAAEVKRLRDEERLTWAQIADRLDLSRSYVSDLYVDPSGERARARKESYRQPCPRCGNPMSGSNGITGSPSMCSDCAAEFQHDEREWTRDKIVETFREFAAVHGRAPTVTDTTFGATPSARARLSPERLAESDKIRVQGPRLPHPSSVTRECGSWQAAVVAADLDPSASGGAAHRGGERRPMGARDETIGLLAALGCASPAEIAELRGVTYNTAWVTLDRLVADGIAYRPERGTYALTGLPARPTERKSTMRDYLVLVHDDETDTYRRLEGATGRTPEEAVEAVAGGAGQYLVVPAQAVQEFKLAPVTKLAVVKAA